MNFLAHTFLSGDSDQIRIGNFIGDYVKGNDFELYPEGIKKGIILHRHIDTFTDTHPVVQASKSRLTPYYHKYSGVIIDIFYDHFLSANWNIISSVPLEELAELTYRTLHENYDLLPVDVQKIVPSFIFNRWLEAYNTIKGIENVLGKMSVITTLPNHTEKAIKELKSHYNLFRQEFFDFFPAIVHYVVTAFEIKLFLADSFIIQFGEIFRKRG